MDSRWNTTALQVVANALGEMRTEVVFVGGATIGLYGLGRTAPESRYTDDIDCIIELSSYGEFAHLEERLRTKGFRNDRESGVQIRWIWEKYVVDVMPTDKGILGFSNPWYTSGMRTAITHTLPDNSLIRILDAPHLLATKCCAMQNRGQDLRYDPDFEDILYVLTYRPQVVAEVAASSSELRKYVAGVCQQLLARTDIRAILDAAKDRNTTVKHLLEMMRHIVELELTT